MEWEAFWWCNTAPSGVMASMWRKHLYYVINWENYQQMLPFLMSVTVVKLGFLSIVNGAWVVYELVCHENWAWLDKGKKTTHAFGLFLSSRKWNVYTSLCQFIICALWRTSVQFDLWICKICVRVEKSYISHPCFSTGILNHLKWIICLLHFYFSKW